MIFLRLNAFIVALVGVLTIFVGHSAYSENDFRMQEISLQDSNIEVFNLDNTKKIVLTFDDGPGRGTEQILNTLKKYNVKATFFALGQQIQKYPELTRRIVAEGHTLANHSYDHDKLTKDIYKQDTSLLLKELLSTHELIKRFSKTDTFYFRAPYAAWLQAVAHDLNRDSEIQKYIGPVCWDVGRSIEYDNGRIANAGDWECWTKKANLTAYQCMTGYYNKIQEIRGGVVLMHDIHLKTAEMVDLLIPALLAQGYEFINLPQVQSLATYRNFLSVVPRILEKPHYSNYRGRCTLTHTISM